VKVRRARWSDVAALVELIERRRTELEALEPRFWRRAPGAAKWTRRYFRLLLLSRRAALFVAEQEEGIAGMLIARRIKAPPVYDPGGVSILVDDFCVAGPALWPIAGAALLAAAADHARQLGAAQLIVVAPAAAPAQAACLEGAGSSPVCCWWVKPL
jgi:ribosomal protein S18 acetylase RimI-like enzyme